MSPLKPLHGDVCNVRYEITMTGAIVRKRRKHPRSQPACPSRFAAIAAYVWSYAHRRYVVALRHETKVFKQGSISCYHVFPTKAAAIMFAMLASEG